MKWELARFLLQHAARRAPPDLAERLEEEWLADLAARTGHLARLRFGVGCCWATTIIAYEHKASNVLATAAVTGSNKAMSAYAQHDDPFFSRRTIFFLAIVGLHVVLIYGLATGLTHKVIAAIPPNIISVILPAHPKQVDAPPVIGAPPLSKTIVVPPPIHTVDIGVDDDAIPAVTGDVIPVSQGQPPPATEVFRQLGGPGKGFPNTEDYYPPDKIRTHQEGAVSVRTCVDERGRLTEAPTVAESSGAAGFDAAALRLAKAGSGHYRATTENGVPVNSCYVYRIKFQMKD